MSDPVLRACVNVVLNQTENSQISDVSVPVVTSLYCVGDGEPALETLEGTENLTSLKSLHIQGGEVADLRPVVGLPELGRLLVRKTELESVAALEKMPLKTLDVSGNHITDLGPLKKNKKLNLFARDQELTRHVEVGEEFPWPVGRNGKPVRVSVTDGVTLDAEQKTFTVAEPGTHQVTWDVGYFSGTYNLWTDMPVATEATVPQDLVRDETAASAEPVAETAVAEETVAATGEKADTEPVTSAEASASVESVTVLQAPVNILQAPVKHGSNPADCPEHQTSKGKGIPATGAEGEESLAWVLIFSGSFTLAILLLRLLILHRSPARRN